MSLICKFLFIAVLFLSASLSAEELSIEDIIQRNVVEPCEKLNKPKSNASCEAKKELRNVAVANTEVAAPTNFKRCNPDRQDVPEKSSMESYSGKSFDVSKVSLDEVQDVFNYVSKQKSRYVLSGGWAMTGACAARSHLIAEDILDDCKVSSGKIFIQPSRIMWQLGLGRRSLEVEAKGRNLRWDKYHVANIVYVESAGKTETYVIDPVLFDKAVPVKEWEAKVKENDSSAQSYVSSKTTLSLSDIAFDDPANRMNLDKAREIIEQARREERIMRGK